jgi:hypothetical protein
MKGIYLTQEGKQEIEAKIAKLELKFEDEKKSKSPLEFLLGECIGVQIILKEILASATILPVEESWNNLSNNTLDRANNSEIYPQGVIIQSK